MKTYTTAQLIETLKNGQAAEMIEPVQDIIVKRTSNGLIIMKDALSEKRIGQPLPLTPIVLQGVWRKCAEKVSFQGAIEALKEGEIVSCKLGQEICAYESLDEIVALREVVEGEWYIGELE